MTKLLARAWHRVDEFTYKWTTIWLVTITVFAAYTNVQGRSTDSQFHALRGGICQIVEQSNKAVPKNREIYLGQISRAKVRLAYDVAHDSPTLAAADRDAISANQRALKRTHKFTLAGC